LRFDEVSRWSVFVEVRDCLRALLAPPLSLAYLLAHGRAVALSLRTLRPRRPPQLVKIREIFQKA